MTTLDRFLLHRVLIAINLMSVLSHSHDYDNNLHIFLISPPICLILVLFSSIMPLLLYYYVVKFLINIILFYIIKI